MIDRFTFETGIHGEGRFGKLRKGRDHALDRDVAIRILSLPAGTFSREVAERLGREAKTLARLTHPNIPAIFDVVFQEDELRIIFEFIAGRNLRELLKTEGACSMGEVKQWFTQIASALDHAHAMHVIHRDIKPENIIVTPDRGAAYLVDFGIALTKEETNQVAGDGYMIGTPGYMSPEQEAAQELDGRTDIYSLGVTLYESLAGKRFAGGQYEELSAANEAVPPEIDALIKDCLLVREKRIQDAKTFRQRLVSALASNKPLSDVVAHGRLHELAAALEELTASEFAKLPLGRRVLILEKAATVASATDNRLIFAAGELLELLVSRGLLLPGEDYREIVRPAAEWAFGSRSATRAGQSIRAALQRAAHESRGDSHSIIVEVICSQLRDCDWQSKPDCFLHSVREIVSTLLANPSCMTNSAELRKILRGVSTLENSRRERPADGLLERRDKALLQGDGPVKTFNGRTVQRWGPPFLLCLLVCLAFGWAHGKRAPAQMREPAFYSDGVGDTLQVFTWLKAASEGGFAPCCHHAPRRLGAPGVANWDDMPMYSVPLFWFFGLVARWTNLITASNLMLFAGHLTSALGFYCACRLLHLRRLWSMLGAMVWAFSFYHRVRGLGHIALAYDFAVPVAIACCWMLSSCGRISRRLFWICAGVSLVVGCGNPYELVLWVQLLFFAILLRFIMWRRWREVIGVVALLGVALASFLAANIPYLVNVCRHGKNPGAFQRSYAMTEVGALKPIELLLPPSYHRLPVLAKFSGVYAGKAVVKSELFSPYLGIVGVAALAWMVFECLCRLGRSQRVPLHLPLCGWIMAWAAVGGGNGLVALCGFPYWRAGNRWSQFILAVSLVFLVSRLSRLTAGRQGLRLAWLYPAAVGLVGLALWDQCVEAAPGTAEAREHGTGDRAEMVQRVRNDQRFGSALESVLEGRAVFQLPLQTWVDAAPVLDCGPYAEVRPFLWTDTVRFSFGRILGREEDAWRTELFQSNNAAEIVSKLRARGFSAILFVRKAFADGAESMVKSLAAVGCTNSINDGLHEQVAVMLK
jgi:serine/threonine protein kinase